MVENRGFPDRLRGSTFFKTSFFAKFFYDFWCRAWALHGREIIEADEPRTSSGNFPEDTRGSKVEKNGGFEVDFWWFPKSEVQAFIKEMSVFADFYVVWPPFFFGKMPIFPEKSRRRLKTRFLTIFLTISDLCLVGDNFLIKKYHFFMFLQDSPLYSVWYTGV